MEVYPMLQKSFTMLKEKKALLALSGGVDSMVLLHLLMAENIYVEVVHVDHQSRKGMSAHDKSFVAQFCKRNNIVLHIKNYRHAKGNFQQEARNFRYSVFNHLLSTRQLDFLLTAHHLEDRKETFLLNAFRGTGLRGLSSLQWKRGHIMRPLIEWKKDEIYNYAAKHQIPYVKDGSNDENTYIRNHIRNNIIPALEKVIPQTNHGIYTTLNNIGSAHSLLDELVDKILNPFISRRGPVLSIHLDCILNLNNGHAFLHHYLSKYGFNEHQVGQLMKSSTGSLFYSDLYIMEKSRNKIFLVQISDKDISPIEIDDYGTYVFTSGISITFNEIDRSGMNSNDGFTLLLSHEKIVFPLIIRTWQPGDFFHPPGMEGKRKKLKKLFGDLKLSIIEKWLTPMIVSDSQIVAILPYHVDSRYTVNEEDEKIIGISLYIKHLGNADF